MREKGLQGQMNLGKCWIPQFTVGLLRLLNTQVCISPSQEGKGS